MDKSDDALAVEYALKLEHQKIALLNNHIKELENEITTRKTTIRKAKIMTTLGSCLLWLLTFIIFINSCVVYAMLLYT